MIENKESFTQENKIESASEKRVWGYIRVSSRYQNEQRQRDALLKAGVPERNILVDKASGKDFNRPEYQKMKSLLRAGDEIVILDLDRLGRDYGEMGREWKELTEDKKCDINIINFPLLSTIQEEKTLTRKVFADIVFSLLCYISEQERRDIKLRQLEGIEAAKRQGIKFGRKKIQRPDNFNETYQRVLRREITNRQAMEELGLKANTYYAFVKEHTTELQQM